MLGARAVVERLDRSPKGQHLYQRKIDHTAMPAKEVDAFLVMLDEVRPHESLAWRRARPPTPRGCCGGEARLVPFAAPR